MNIFEGVRKALGLGKKTEEEEPVHEHEEFTADDYAHIVTAQRVEKDRFFEYHPSSPLTPEQREKFNGLAYYPPDLTLRFELPLERHATPEPVTIQTSTGHEQVYRKIGQVRFEVDGQPATLQVYEPEGGGDYFVPFRDATSGKETYGAGRYLEPPPLERDRLLVDFNLAYNPYCTYNEPPSLAARAGREPMVWTCPLPPLENWLKVPIRAGEKQPTGEWVEHEEPPDQAAE